MLKSLECRQCGTGAEEPVQHCRKDANDGHQALGGHRWPLGGHRRAPGLHFETLGFTLMTRAPQGRQRSPKGAQMKKETLQESSKGRLWVPLGDHFGTIWATFSSSLCKSWVLDSQRFLFSRIFAAGESGLSEVEPPGLVSVSLSMRFSNWSVWKTLCT